MSRFTEELIGARWSRSRNDLLARGVSPASLRGPRWRRTSTGFYRPAAAGAVPVTPTQRILDAVPLIPAGGALGGWAAAYVHGVDWLDGLAAQGATTSVPVILGTTVDRMPPDPRFYRGLLEDDELDHRHGIVITSLERTAFDCARWSSGLAAAVSVVDAILHFTPLDRGGLADWLPRVRGWRGVRRVRQALALADGSVRSPWESRLRVLYVVDAGLPRPLVNARAVDRRTGLVLGEVDLLDPQAGMAIEYDGAYHRDSAQHHADNQREEALEAAGLIVLRVDAVDLADAAHRRALVHRLRAARLRGLGRDRGSDFWVVSA